MTANLDRTNVNWVSKLPAIKLAYNSKVHRSTGVTPPLAFLGHEVKLTISLMIPAPEDKPFQYKWLSSLQETYTKTFEKMYSAQEQVNRTNARLYSNKKAPFAVGTIVWYFAKRQVAGKPPKLTQKWTGLLYRVTLVFNEICLELTAVSDPRNIIQTTIHYVHPYKGANMLHHSIDRPDQLVLPCPDTEEDIDFQHLEPATPLGLSTDTQEQIIQSVNPGSLEEDEDLDPPVTRSGATFRRAMVPRVNPTQPTVPPVDYSQEFGASTILNIL